MNILLTGSGGFIGSHLKEGFQQRGYKLFCPRSYELDLTDKDVVSAYFLQHRFDAIVHCATIGGIRGKTDPQGTEKSNVQMLENLLECKEQNCRVITFGSGAMYNKKRSLNRVKESEIGVNLPEDEYGRSKLEFSRICRERNDSLCLNIFACYGKGEKTSRFPSYVIGQILNNEDIVISNNCVFDYLYVDDLVAIVDLLMRYPKDLDAKVINLSPDDSIELQKLAKTVSGFRDDYRGSIKIVNHSAPNYTGDNSLLRNELARILGAHGITEIGTVDSAFIKNGKFEFTPAEQGLRLMYKDAVSRKS